ncbi:MAG: hypothetical protein HRU19_18015 [Pseudobacteriovorax sp.]|nr:hypothetical protein [Pseudobacteriovorax sp.]
MQDQLSSYSELDASILVGSKAFAGYVQVFIEDDPWQLVVTMSGQYINRTHILALLDIDKERGGLAPDELEGILLRQQTFRIQLEVFGETTMTEVFRARLSDLTFSDGRAHALLEIINTNGELNELFQELKII